MRGEAASILRSLRSTKGMDILGRNADRDLSTSVEISGVTIMSPAVTLNNASDYRANALTDQG